MAAEDRFTSIKTWLTKQSSLPEHEHGTAEEEAASEGARGTENAKDVKKSVGASSVESANKNPETGKADSQGGSGGHTGLKQTSVGEMPEVENSAKNVELPEHGSKKAMEAVNIIIAESEKLASSNFTNDSEFEIAFQSFLKASNQLPIILAAAGIPSMQTVTTDKKAAAQPAEQIKVAEDQALANVIETYRRHGEAYGEAASGYILGHNEAINWLKQSMDDGTLEQLLASQGAAAGGAGGMPPGAGAEVPSPMAPGAGGDIPPGAGGEVGPPGVDDHASAMGELGIPPEELEKLITLLQAELAKTQGGAGGEGGGEMPPDEKAAIDRAMNHAVKLAADVKAHLRSGKFRLKPAADGTPERARRDVARSYFLELQKAAG